MKLLHTVVKKIFPVLFLGLLVVETSHAEWVNLGTRTYSRLCPEWTGGDREYAGHGPEVSARAELVTENSDTELHIRIEMHQLETKSDWSKADLFSTFLIYRAPAGRRITSIFNSLASEIYYVDDNHALDQFFPSDTLVQQFQVMGDTGGKDIGNCTLDDAYLNVFLRPLQVFLQ